MTTGGILLLGCALGMRHALDADHIAAVATLVSRKGSLSDSVRQGTYWGIGHTLTLFLFGSLVLILRVSVPEELAGALEFGVGVMLVVLGADVLYRMRTRLALIFRRLRDNNSHDDQPGQYQPLSRTSSWRALLVGLMHGMAGSAALILLTIETVDSASTGLLYIGLFGAGSIIGMAVLSVVLAVPLRSAQRFPELHSTILSVVGVIALLVGILLMTRSISIFS